MPGATSSVLAPSVDTSYNTETAVLSLLALLLNTVFAHRVVLSRLHFRQYCNCFEALDRFGSPKLLGQRRIQSLRTKRPNKKLLGAKGIATRSKDATRNKKLLEPTWRPSLIGWRPSLLGDRTTLLNQFLHPSHLSRVLRSIAESSSDPIHWIRSDLSWNT